MDTELRDQLDDETRRTVERAERLAATIGMTVDEVNAQPFVAVITDPDGSERLSLERPLDADPIPVQEPADEADSTE